MTAGSGVSEASRGAQSVSFWAMPGHLFTDKWEC